jgi:peptide/nickel transport system permease protein
MVRTSKDTEFTPPEPMSADAQDTAAAELGRRGGASIPQIVLNAILPGAGHLLRGEWARGLWLLVAWGVLLGTGFIGWERIEAIFAARRTPVDGMIAVGTLGLLILGTWLWGLYDLAVTSRRPARVKGDSQWAIAGRQFRKNKLAIAGLLVMLVLYLVAILAPIIAPYDPAAQGNIVLTRYRPPSAENLLGTDKFGRDIFSRVIYGARISLSIGFIAVGIGLVLGTAVGALAGYFGRWVDTVLMRFTDMMLSIPRLILLIVTIALFTPSIWLVVIVLGLTGWMSVARIVRGEVLSLREREFVQAAKALGMNDGRIILRHIIPNTLAPVIVYATLGIGNTILVEAALSFLGLGVQPPTPSWGNMVSDGRDALITAWWIATFPGLAIVLTVTAFNLLGDGLRDALDPRLRT